MTLLEREKGYLVIVFCCLSLVVVVVLGLSYYFWRQRRRREEQERRASARSNGSKRRSSPTIKAGLRGERKSSQASANNAKVHPGVGQKTHNDSPQGPGPSTRLPDGV